MRDIPNYENLYAATEDGQIWSYKSKKFLMPFKRKEDDNYLSIDLCKDGQKKSYQVHRLIALTFIPNEENKLTVDHIDRNTLNNCVSNLRWATSLEQAKNRDYSNNTGFVIKKKIQMRDKDNHSIIIKEFNTMQEAVLEVTNGKQKNSSLIRKVCNGQKLSAYGYFWSDIDD